MHRKFIGILLALAVLATAQMVLARDDDHHEGDRRLHYVATATNEPSNALRVWERVGDQLVLKGSFPTGGTGTNASLGNASGVVRTNDGKFVFVVNAGSNDISMFDMTNSVMFLGKFSSHGTVPVSLALHALNSRTYLLYVLNAGGAGGGSIAGFKFDASTASVMFLAGSVQPVSGAGANVAQIGFTPNGNVLVVTEKGTNKITTYVVSAGGIAGAPNPQNSVGATPFGFGFSAEGFLLVSEPAGALSSYRVRQNGTIQPVTSSLSDGQAAACWVVVVGNKVYVTNAASNNLSLYRVKHNGQLVLQNDIVAYTSAQPVDMAVAGDNLYVLGSNGHAVHDFDISHDGQLTLTDTDTGIPGVPFGMVAY